jgi:hypothetical protein
VRKHEREKQLGRAKRKYEDTVKMDIQELGWGMEWIDLVENRDS